MNKINLLITLVFILYFGLNVKSQDWPSYAGPSYNYVSSSLDTSQIVKNKNYITLEWESADTFGLGSGRSQSERYGCGNLDRIPSTHCASPIVYDNKVYQYYLEPVGPHYSQSIVDELIYNDGCDSQTVYDRLDLWYIEAKDNILCLDANTGKKLWKTSFEGFYAKRWDKPRGANNTICAANGFIYGYTSMGKVYCLNASTGNVVWETPNWPNKESDLSNSIASSSFGTTSCIYGSSVVYADGVVLFGIGGTLYAYDALNGNELWTKAGSLGDYANPTVWEYDGNTYIISGKDGNVYCLNTLNGNIQWSLSGLGNNFKDIIVNDNYMMCYMEGSDDNDQKIGIYSISSSGATFLWSHNEATSIYSPAGVIADGLVFKVITSASKLYVFDVLTGNVLASKSAPSSAHYFYYVDGKIITETDFAHPSSNSYVVYEANADTIYRLFTWRPPHDYTNGYETTMSFPIVNNKIYVRGRQNMYCYDWSEKYKELASVVLPDNQTSVLSGQTKSFYNIEVFDQYGVTYDSAVTVSWNIMGKGSVDQNGQYTAPLLGNIVDTLIVTVSKTSIEVKDTAYITVKKPQSISCLDLSEIYIGVDPFELQCTASSGLPVTYSKISGPFALSGSTVSSLGVPGTARITVQQEGNDLYAPANIVLYTFDFTNDLNDTLVTGNENNIKENIEFTVSPNPTKGIIRIETNQLKLVNIQIYNMLGSEVFSNSFYNNNSIIINLSNQPKGIYLIKLNNKTVSLIRACQ